MTGEVIKQFLVGLGFGVDESSLKKFGKAIDHAYTRVALISGAIATAAAGTFAGIAKISEGFEQMGYEYRIIAPAINKAIILRRALISAYKEAGIGMVDAVQKSVKFNLSLAKTKFQLEGIVKSTALKFIPMLTKQMDMFRAKISANMPKILAVLEKMVKFIFKAFEGVVILGTRLWSILGRVWGLFERLDDLTGGWSTKIIGLIAAWRLLNLAFLTTPLGMILTGLLAILALYDDFMTWKEGGESLFDWAVWVPAIDAFCIGLESMWSVLKQVWITAKGLALSFKKLWDGDYSGFFDGLIQYAKNVLGIFTKLFEHFGKFANFASAMGNGIVDGVGGLFESTPLGANGGNQTSQNVTQKTEIIVQGTGDAVQTARMVGNEQSRVNSNMTRNMKGAAR